MQVFVALHPRIRPGYAIVLGAGNSVNLFFLRKNSIIDQRIDEVLVAKHGYTLTPTKVGSVLAG